MWVAWYIVVVFRWVIVSAASGIIALHCVYSTIPCIQHSAQTCVEPQLEHKAMKILTIPPSLNRAFCFWSKFRGQLSWFSKGQLGIKYCWNRLRFVPNLVYKGGIAFCFKKKCTGCYWSMKKWTRSLTKRKASSARMYVGQNCHLYSTNHHRGCLGCHRWFVVGIWYSKGSVGPVSKSLWGMKIVWVTQSISSICEPM